MKRILLTAVSALALAACADTTPSPIEPGGPPSFTSGQRWNIFTTQTPELNLDATPGWEVATRFYTTVPGCIVQIHFYRAEGETGTNYVNLWTNGGTLLYSSRIADSYSGSGWHTLFLEPRVGPPYDARVCIDPWTYYRVSVNTNTRQAKTYAYFDNYGIIQNGPLIADFSFYGQPMGSMPTQGSGSIYFIDVTFEES